jgi:hypothetical protein
MDSRFDRAAIEMVRSAWWQEIPPSTPIRGSWYQIMRPPGTAYVTGNECSGEIPWR